MQKLEELKRLKTMGNVPMTAGVLRNLFGDSHSPEKKIHALENAGVLIRLKRGLYVVSPEISGKPLSLELIANHIYGPSYVSLHYALRYYGLIPEGVYTLTSVTSHHTRTFENSLARFTYRGVSADYFPIGVRSESRDGVAFLMATPEKALCDMLMDERHVPSQSVVSLEVFFEEDMRIDVDAIRQMNPAIIRACMEAGNKKKLLGHLLKLMKR